MSGFFGIVLLGILGVSAIKDAADKAYFMSKPSGEYKDGTSYYMDGNLNTYANGEKIIKKPVYDAGGNLKLIDVGKRSGRVYADPEQEYMDRENERSLQSALKMGKMAYVKIDPKFSRFGCKKRAICEISTGRYIANIGRNMDGTCWKTYMVNDLTIERYLNNKYGGRNSIGEKVQITEEEFNKLNVGDNEYYMVYDLKK